MTVQIIRATLTPWSGSFKAPLQTARARYALREGWSLELTDERGQRGRGESVPLVEFGTESLDDCVATLRTVLRALEGKQVGPGLQDLWGLLAGLEAYPAARHGLELALLELMSVRAGVPLRRFLDPAARARVAVSTLLSSREPDEIRRAAEEGYRTWKIKVAAGPVRDDLAWLETVRRAAPTVALRLDANGGWTRAQAVEALAATAAFRPELCEQPVKESDVDALAHVSRLSTVPIAADETLADPQRVEQLLARGPVVGVFVLKPMVLGGLLPALALAQRAAERGIVSYVTSSLDGPVSRAGAAQLAAALPASSHHASGLAVGTLYDGAAGVEPYRLEQGEWVLDEEPGLGVLA